jgi:hypothetical protein
MRERIVVICPTPQAKMHTTDWHDGQFAHGVHAGFAGRAKERNPLFDLHRERMRDVVAVAAAVDKACRATPVRRARTIALARIVELVVDETSDSVADLTKPGRACD